MLRLEPATWQSTLRDSRPRLPFPEAISESKREAACSAIGKLKTTPCSISAAHDHNSAQVLSYGVRWFPTCQDVLDIGGDAAAETSEDVLKVRCSKVASVSRQVGKQSNVIRVDRVGHGECELSTSAFTHAFKDHARYVPRPGLSQFQKSAQIRIEDRRFRSLMRSGAALGSARYSSGNDSRKESSAT